MGAKRSGPKWILASASPRRSEILNRLGMQFLVDPSGISEPERNAHEAPAKYAVRLARLKAEEVARRHKSGLVLSADTIVVLGRSILMKPGTRAEARSMLARLSGRWHEVLSGICLLECEVRRIHATFSRSRVHFRRLSQSEIEWYLKTGEYRDKAGAYGAQGHASLFIDRIEGCYFNIVGFPIAAFVKLCRKAGIDLTRAWPPCLAIPDSDRLPPAQLFAQQFEKIVSEGQHQLQRRSRSADPKTILLP